MNDERLLDASEVEDQLAQVREENQAAARDADIAVSLFSYGPLRFIMKDAATDMVEDVPDEYLQPDGPNLEAASYFSTLMRESGYSHERYAAEALLWGHLAASDWREGQQTTEEALDRLERALFLLVAERLRVLVTKQKIPVVEQVRQLQEIRLKERGEHKSLRKTRSAQVNGLNQGRAAMAVAAAEKKDRARKLAKEFPGKKGQDLAYAIRVSWKDHWPNEEPPSERSIYRYLGG